MFNILVAEDNKNSAKLLKIILNQAGYTVFLAGNGIEALDIMDKKHVDIIVLDVMMPKMDGFEFTRQLRAVDDRTPIIMLTAKQQDIDKCNGFIAGTDDYMVKPFNEQELLLRIKALLRRSQINSERKITIGNVMMDYDALSVKKGQSDTDSAAKGILSAVHSPFQSRKGVYETSAYGQDMGYGLGNC